MWVHVDINKEKKINCRTYLTYYDHIAHPEISGVESYIWVQLLVFLSLIAVIMVVVEKFHFHLTYDEELLESFVITNSFHLRLIGLNSLSFIIWSVFIFFFFACSLMKLLIFFSVSSRS